MLLKDCVIVLVCYFFLIDSVFECDYLFSEEIRCILISYFFEVIFVEEDEFGFCFLNRNMFDGF